LILDASDDAYAPYIETSLAVRDQEFPQAKNSNSREFFDNSFVENLEKAGFFATIGLGR